MEQPLGWRNQGVVEGGGAADSGAIGPSVQSTSSFKSGRQFPLFLKRKKKIQTGEHTAVLDTRGVLPSVLKQTPHLWTTSMRTGFC
jgi:hypothetical protein